MSVEPMLEIDERTRGAIAEIQSLIRERYPEAAFRVGEGDDPEGIYLWATVDVEDADEVMEVYRDRLLDMQIDEGIELYVIPLETPERSAKYMRSHPFVPRVHQLTADGSILTD